MLGSVTVGGVARGPTPGTMVVKFEPATVPTCKFWLAWMVVMFDMLLLPLPLMFELINVMLLFVKVFVAPLKNVFALCVAVPLKIEAPVTVNEAAVVARKFAVVPGAPWLMFPLNCEVLLTVNGALTLAAAPEMVVVPPTRLMVVPLMVEAPVPLPAVKAEPPAEASVVAPVEDSVPVTAVAPVMLTAPLKFVARKLLFALPFNVDWLNAVVTPIAWLAGAPHHEPKV